MSKRIFIDGNINSELCIIATDGQDINYFDYSDELISSKKNNIYLTLTYTVGIQVLLYLLYLIYDYKLYLHN